MPSLNRLLVCMSLILQERAGAQRTQQRVGFALLMLAYIATYVLLGYLQFYHWTITSGLLFAVLWWLPRRWWPGIFLATIAARLIGGIIGRTL
jgi:hypothetical protein